MGKRRRTQKKDDSRRRAHIDKGERAFLPPERMARIRWEESVAHAEARRSGLEEHKLVHGHCHCGSIECLGVPFVTAVPGKAPPKRSDSDS